MSVEKKNKQEGLTKKFRLITLKVNATPAEKAYLRSLREWERRSTRLSKSQKICGPINQNYNPNLITIGYDY